MIHRGSDVVESILQRAPETLDAALDLRAVGADRADAELDEGPSQLGGHTSIDELLLECQGRREGRLEDACTVS